MSRRKTAQCLVCAAMVRSRLLTRLTLWQLRPPTVVGRGQRRLGRPSARGEGNVGREVRRVEGQGTMMLRTHARTLRHWRRASVTATALGMIAILAAGGAPARADRPAGRGPRR